MGCRRDSSDDIWTLLMYTSYAQYHINNAQLCVNLGLPPYHVLAIISGKISGSVCLKKYSLVQR